MLLRRVIEHVKAQNWTAVTLDFVIVVVGVFIGIQVSNWNESRLEYSRASGFLDRIKADLASDIETLQKRKQFWDVVLKNGYAAIDYAENGVLHEGSEWATLRAFLHAGQVWRWSFNDTTYTELRSSGELRLIRDVAIRDELAFYYVITGRRRDGVYTLLPDYRAIIRGRMPATISKYYWDACHHASVGQQSLSDCESPEESFDARVVLDRLVSDQDLINALRFWIDSQALLISLSEIDLQVARNLVATVEAAR